MITNKVVIYQSNVYDNYINSMLTMLFMFSVFFKLVDFFLFDLSHATMQSDHMLVFTVEGIDSTSPSSTSVSLNVP